MFMRFTLGNISISGNQRRVWHFLQFSTKTNFLGLSAWVGIETNFPLKWAITNHVQH